MSTATKCCRACKWAQWQMTPAQNIRRNRAGVCGHPPIKEPIVPECTRGYTDRLNDRNGIWPDDGEKCPCFCPSVY